MFTSHLVALAFVFVFAVVNVVALPVPGAANVRLGYALGQRDPTQFEPILAYVKREGVWDTQDLGKRALDINTVAEETPTKGENNQIIPIRRAPQILEQDPVKSVGAGVVPF